MKYSANFPDLSRPAVMGILNITPDSFYDGSRHADEKSGQLKAEEMIAAGAAIIDIGGTSTRPGAKEISREQEWERIAPVLKAVRKNFSTTCISVDTYHALIAERALDEGADMINDISGGTFDAKMPPLIGKWNAYYVIMHIQGRPGNMQLDPVYNDVTEDIAAFFDKQIRIFNALGAGRLIIDPGFGFGKNLEHNFKLLKDLKRFSSFGYPVMAGLSRKSMINRVIGTSPDEALNGTTVLNTIALLNGANILRVHDVKEAIETIKLLENL